MNYVEIEARRRAIGGISRAAMCRRADVNESTVSIGVKKHRTPINAVRDRLLQALSGLEAERRSRVGNGNGASE